MFNSVMELTFKDFSREDHVVRIFADDGWVLTEAEGVSVCYTRTFTQSAFLGKGDHVTHWCQVREDITQLSLDSSENDPIFCKVPTDDYEPYLIAFGARPVNYEVVNIHDGTTLPQDLVEAFIEWKNLKQNDA